MTLDSSEITFFPEENNDGPGAEIGNGTFSISEEPGPVVNPNRIVIRSVQPTGRRVRYNSLIESDGPMVQRQMVEEYRDMIPPQYDRRSVLRWSIQLGFVNVRDFDLESK